MGIIYREIGNLICNVQLNVSALDDIKVLDRTGHSLLTIMLFITIYCTDIRLTTIGIDSPESIKIRSDNIV